MKEFIVLFVALFALSTGANAQDTILDAMRRKAEVVARVEVLDHKQIFYSADGTGIEPYSMLCRVIEPIKGAVTANEKMRVVYHRYEEAPPAISEPPLVEKGKEYVIFLKKGQEAKNPSAKKTEISYRLLDRWVGVIPYHYHLISRLKHMEQK